MKEREKVDVDNYNKMKIEVLKKVSEVGPMGEMDSWRKAYPDLDFHENVYSLVNDEAVFGKGSVNHEIIKVNWEERTIAERVFFVLFYEHFVDMEIRFDVVIGDELKITQTVENPDVIWFMWIDGCFSGEELTEEALRDYVGLMTDCDPAQREFVDDADIDDIKIAKLEFKVGSK